MVGDRRSSGRVNILGRSLEVAEAIKYVSGRLVVDGSVKSKASRRVLGLPDELATILAEHLAQQSLTGADAEALVFSSPRGGPLNYQNFMFRIWKPAVTTAGLEGVTAHDLRHSTATYLDAVGAPEQLMRRRLATARATHPPCLRATSSMRTDSESPAPSASSSGNRRPTNRRATSAPVRSGTFVARRWRHAKAPDRGREVA